jgi:hypothetical protein
MITAAATGEGGSSDARSRRTPVSPRSARPRRVVILLLSIVLLSTVDLVITVINLRTVGMIEVNPIAHYIVSTTQSATALAFYKVFTVVVCVALLYRLRHSVQCELAAWFCVVVLAALACYWGIYSDRAHDPTNLWLRQNQVTHDNWLTLAD